LKSLAPGNLPGLGKNERGDGSVLGRTKKGCFLGMIRVKRSEGPWGKMKGNYAQENSKTAKHFAAPKANYRRPEKIDH
jgi:hypothetical protein